MGPHEKDKIRLAVRESYGRVAKDGRQIIGIGPEASCCTPKDAAPETDPAASCCLPSNVTTEQISAIIGYSEEDINSAPAGANMGLGCGNPVALASLKSGETVEEIQNDLALVAACAGGAATIDETETLLRKAGFRNIKIRPKDEGRKLISEWSPDKSKNAGDYLVSASIEAVK